MSIKDSIKKTVTVPTVSTLTKPKNTIKDRVKTNQFLKPHYTQRDIDKLNALDLIHLLVWWDEASLVYIDNHLKLKLDEDCIVYSEGVYNTKSNRVYNVVDTLKELYNLTFPKACFIAKTFMSSVPFYAIREYCDLKYPNAKKTNMSCDFNYNSFIDNSLFNISKDDSIKRAFAILHTRFKIDRSIVSELIHREMLVMNEHKDLCFLCRDNYNVVSVVKYLENMDYTKTEVLTVRRNMGFRYATKEETAYNLFRYVYVFESVIDILSYLTLVKMGALPPIEKASCLISLNGLSNGVLYNFLIEHQEVQGIYACLHNDNAGILATKGINQRVVVDMQPYLRDFSLKKGYVKTWNEMLKKELKK